VVGMCGTWSASLVWLGVLIDMAATDVDKLAGRPGRSREVAEGEVVAESAASRRGPGKERLLQEESGREERKRG
jgi:hypothetical protein